LFKSEIWFDRIILALSAYTFGKVLVLKKKEEFFFGHMNVQEKNKIII